MLNLYLVTTVNYPNQSQFKGINSGQHKCCSLPTAILVLLHSSVLILDTRAVLLTTKLLTTFLSGKIFLKIFQECPVQGITLFFCIK